MKILHSITWILIIIGGLNWLLVGIFGNDVFGMLNLGGMSGSLARTVYVLVGLSAIYEIAVHKTNCRLCGKSAGSSM